LKKKFLAVILTLIIVLAVNAITANAQYFLEADRLYITATNHFDTVWNWPVEYSINHLLPSTLRENFSLFEQYPDHVFSFEGAYRYQLAEEYYPEEFERLKDYVDKGNWSVAGSAIENGDVNVPSPEALFRNFLYGNNYFEDKFGKRSKDIFLPDCFGFGYALPSIAEHSNLLGFTTMKLADNNMTISTRPFDIGRWYGVNGKYVIANIKASWPGQKTALRTSSSDISRLNSNKNSTGAGLGYNAASVMIGDGDLGGGADANTVRLATEEQKANTPSNVNVVSASSDQIFRDMTETQKNALLSHNGEMLLRQHGTGSYSAQTISKRWNRKGEIIADAAERSAVAASWLGAADYPLAKFTEAWNYIIRHQFHDDITGTSSGVVYTRTQNEYMIAIKEFAFEYTNGVDGVASSMKTTVNANSVPLVVNNPLSYNRSDIVETTVIMPSDSPYVKVYNTDGNEVASQVISKQGSQFDIAFIATVGSLGYRTYEVRPSNDPCSIESGLTISANTMSNDKYTVSINANGDISSVYDKITGKELLNAPVRFAQFSSTSTGWPAWELVIGNYWNVTTPQLGYVGSTGVPSIKVLENGPARVSLQIDRTYRNSTYSQIVSLTAGGNIVKIDNTIDWREQGAFLKAVFDLTSANSKATYDLGLGAIERENNVNIRGEVPHQKWADLTAADSSFGVSILNDCKYGIDKPNNSQLRLTIAHTAPTDFIHSKTLVPSGQQFAEFGENRFAYGIYSHEGVLSGGKTQEEAEAFNQPMKAFQTTSHDGHLGDNYSFASISNDRVIVRAVKKAERSDEIVVRVNEGSGMAAQGVTLTVGEGIESAREIYASEENIGPATVVDGKLVFDIDKYDVKSFALTLKPPATQVQKETWSTVELPYNIDVYSYNSDKADGGMTLMKDCFPAELVPDIVLSGATQYKMGSKADGALNAVAAKGQTISLPSGYNTLKILASSTVGDIAVPFRFGNSTTTVEVGDYSENIAGWDSFIMVREGYIKDQQPGFVATHRHTDGKDNVAATTYMFAYSLDIPAGATSVTLPDNSGVLIYAATVVNDSAKLSVGSILYDTKEPSEKPKFNLFNGYTGFEMDDPAPTINTASSRSNVTNQLCELSTEKAFMGTQSLKISGTDNNASSAYVYFDIITDHPFKIVPGTTLSYKFYAGNDLGRYVAIDMPIYDGDINMYNGGSNLRDRASALDMNENVRIHPNTGHGVVGEWVTVTVDLYACAPESTVSKIMLDYSNSNGTTGDFFAYIDDLSIQLPQPPEGQNELVWSIERASALDTSKYSKTSVENLNKAVDLGNIVVNTANPSRNEIQYAVTNLQKAMYNDLVTIKDPYNGISALDFNSYSDVTFNNNTIAKRTDYINNITSGDFIIFRGIDFGDTAPAEIGFEYTSSYNTNAYVDVRLNHQNGPLIARVPLPSTGGSSTYNWSSAVTEIPITGERDICLLFNANGNVVNNLRSIKAFETSPWSFNVTLTSNGNPIQNLRDAVGGAVVADVTLTKRGEESNVSVIAGLYDQAGRLYSVQTVNLSAPKGEGGNVKVSLDIPAAGMLYKLFIWDAESYIPLREPVILVDKTKTIGRFETAPPMDGTLNPAQWGGKVYTLAVGAEGVDLTYYYPVDGYPPADFASDIYLAYDANNLYLGMIVTDPLWMAARPGSGTLWQGCGIQVNVWSGRTGTRSEYGFALTASGPSHWQWANGTGTTALPTGYNNYSIKRVGDTDTFIYTIAIPLNSFRRNSATDPLSEGDELMFSIAYNYPNVSRDNMICSIDMGFMSKSLDTARPLMLGPDIVAK